MTQLRDRLELRLYDDMDAMERMQEIGEKQKAAAMREKRLDTNRFGLPLSDWFIDISLSLVWRVYLWYGDRDWFKHTKHIYR